MAITTEAVNALGERVEMRLCSDPTDRAAELYRTLGYPPSHSNVTTYKPPIHHPKQICSTHVTIFKTQLLDEQDGIG